MRDRYGIPISRNAPLSGDRLRSNPEPGSDVPYRPFSKGTWQGYLFICAGLVAAILIANAAVSSIVGLSSAREPVEQRHYEVPAFASLVECDAHFSHEILRIKNNLPAHNTATDMPLLHRNYRRLNRILRQVGRRDGIPPEAQTEYLRKRVRQLNQLPHNSAAAASRDAKCRAMAELPIARKRHSQLIVGR